LLPQKIKDPTLVPKDNLNGDLYYAENGLLLKRNYSFDGNKFNLGEQEYVKTGTAFRPGGSPFYLNSKLFLPIQDNSNGYGTNLIAGELMESGGIVSGSSKYLLKPNMKLPEFAAGMHHISFSNLGSKKIVAFDGRSLVSESKSFNFKFFFKYNYLSIWDGVFGSNVKPFYPFNE
jgi:hypothetical protein